MGNCKIAPANFVVILQINLCLYVPCIVFPIKKRLSAHKHSSLKQTMESRTSYEMIFHVVPRMTQINETH